MVGAEAIAIAAAESRDVGAKQFDRAALRHRDAAHPWTVEALARSGVGRLTLIDMDDVCITNTNRQLPALSSDGRALLAEARSAAADLRDLAGRLGGKADGALGRLENVLAALDQGDGFAAQMLHDREIFYDLKELVRDLKQHPWKVLWKD